MELSADTRSELLAQFAAVVHFDAPTADLPSAERAATACQQLRGFIAARDAELTPLLAALRRQAALDALREPDPDHHPDGSGDGRPNAPGSDGHDGAGDAPGDCAGSEGCGTEVPGDGDSSNGRDNSEHAGDDPGRAGGGSGTAGGGTAPAALGNDADSAAAGDDAAGDGRGDDPGRAGGSPAGAPRESARDRRQRELRSKWLAVFRGFAQALAAGRVAPEHADHLAKICLQTPEPLIAALRADEARLVQLAVTYPPDAFAINVNDWLRDLRADNGASEFQQQLANSRAWMWHDRVTGMYHLAAAFDPRRGPVLQHALDMATATLRRDDHRRTRQELAAEALFGLITGGQATAAHPATTTDRLPAGDAHASADERGDISKPLVDPAAAASHAGALVVVDVRTAVTGVLHPGSVCENIDGVALPAAFALQACALGNVRAAILDRAGKPADLTTNQRLATAAQRLDVRAMGNQCVHPDCSQPWSRCHLHHVRFHHDDHGPTAVSNLVPLCVAHHHDIHDRGWQLTIDADRALRWYQPDGRLYAEVPPTRLGRRHRPPPDANAQPSPTPTPQRQPPTATFRSTSPSAAAPGTASPGAATHTSTPPPTTTPGEATHTSTPPSTTAPGEATHTSTPPPTTAPGEATPTAASSRPAAPPVDAAPPATSRRTASPQAVSSRGSSRRSVPPPPVAPTLFGAGAGADAA